MQNAKLGILNFAFCILNFTFSLSYAPLLSLHHCVNNIQMPDSASSVFEMHPFFEMSPDLVCIAGEDGYFRKINPTALRKLEYTEAELFASPIHTFIHPNDKELTAGERKKLLDGKALINFQNRYISKSGKVLWLDWTSIYFPEEQIVFAIAKDLTDRKQKEIQLEEKYTKLKSLASHFKTTIEKDRKFLAIELHEELSQLAAVVKMDIASIRDSISDLSEFANSKIDHALGITDLIIDAIRRISFSISPNMLDDFGLDETLRWLCSEFTVMNSIPCEYRGDFEEADIKHETKLDCFRICQEALNNVSRHAQAEEVHISIKTIGDSICLSISDNGKGFVPEEAEERSGFINIKERTAFINGKLTIASKPGKGTVVSVIIPLQTSVFNSGV